MGTLALLCTRDLGTPSAAEEVPLEVGMGTPALSHIRGLAVGIAVGEG